MYLLPAVNGNYRRLNGSFLLTEIVEMDNMFPASNRVFGERLRRIGNYRVTERSGGTICWQKDESLKKEAYRLYAENGRVVITSAGECGYAYGLVTLLQMIASQNGQIQNCIVEDEPRFPVRGIMLDVCRHFFTAEEVKKIIEQMSLLKMNRFHWHLTNDQGFRIESKKFPELKAGCYRRLAEKDPVVMRGIAEKGDFYGGFYTQEEIKDVVAFARERQVEIIPEVSMPGHSSAILAVYPQYTCSGEPLKVRNTFGVHDRIFCAGKEDTFSFLEELLDEVMGLFPGEYIHLGGDEVPKTKWHECPACNRRMKQLKFSNYEQLQCYFTNRMAEYVKSHGKKAIVWQEAAFAGNLENSAVIQYWMEMGTGPSYVEPEIEKGRKFILSSMNQFYCDYSYAEIPLRATLLYEPKLKVKRVPEENVLGVEAPMWTEWTPEEKDIEEMIYPRMLAVAECGWTRKRNEADFLRRAETYLHQDGLQMLHPMPWRQATVSGREALHIIAEKMLELGQKYGSMAEKEDPEEAGRVEAVTPETEEGEPQQDMAAMIKSYLTERMAAAYTKEEIDTVMEIIMGKMTMGM